MILALLQKNWTRASFYCKNKLCHNNKNTIIKKLSLSHAGNEFNLVSSGCKSRLVLKGTVMLSPAVAVLFIIAD